MSNFFYLNPYLQSEPEPILRDVFDNWLTNGIFHAMSQNSRHTLPWVSDATVQSTTLDMEYFGNHSGAKFCSPIVKMLLQDGELSNEAIEALADIILTKYNKNWKRLWDTYVLQYSPNSNYNLTETRNLSRSTTEDVERGVTENYSGTEDLEHGLRVETTLGTTDLTTHGRTDTSTSYQYGFNEDDQNEDPADKTVNVAGGTTDVTRSGTDTKENTGHDITSNNSENTREDNTNREGSLAETESISRTGKIGDRTIQSLIAEDREIWLWNYFETIFNNVDEELTLAVYDGCRV